MFFTRLMKRAGIDTTGFPKSPEGGVVDASTLKKMKIDPWVCPVVVKAEPSGDKKRKASMAPAVTRGASKKSRATIIIVEPAQQQVQAPSKEEQEKEDIVPLIRRRTRFSRLVSQTKPPTPSASSPQPQTQALQTQKRPTPSPSTTTTQKQPLTQQPHQSGTSQTRPKIILKRPAFAHTKARKVKKILTLFAMKSKNKALEDKIIADTEKEMIAEAIQISFEEAKAARRAPPPFGESSSSKSTPSSPIFTSILLTFEVPSSNPAQDELSPPSPTLEVATSAIATTLISMVPQSTPSLVKVEAEDASLGESEPSKGEEALAPTAFAPSFTEDVGASTDKASQYIDFEAMILHKLI
ncbi:hypothetical protein Fmac_026329 [Flemingia macrophylla]|uniref:Uncharacterized protein n=1 Tax=Flemingia macrophylla TaxID=520843 RepID=A0ABD1LG83_9FABA